MNNSKYLRAVMVAFALAALTLSSGARSLGPFTDSGEPAFADAGTPEVTLPAPDTVASTSTFYSLRRDLRRCVSPLCGGYYIKSVNLSDTRCDNRRAMRRECYVAEIDWNGQPQVDPSRSLLRGSIVGKRYGKFGELHVLRVTESWQAASDLPAVGDFYFVRDRGLRCITFPCLTHYEAKLNSTFVRNIAGVDLTGASASDDKASQALAAMTSVNGVIVAGDHAPVKGPGGRALQLKATQFYLRAGGGVVAGPPSTRPPPGKKCFKTGCAGQVCADKDLITTCEWRPEYECYQKARCERQADGNCGFTKTPELTSCLARIR